MSLPTPPETPPRTPPRRSQQRDSGFLLKDGQYAFKVGKGKIDSVHVSLDAENLSAQLGRLDPDALRREICSPAPSRLAASPRGALYTPPPTPPRTPPPRSRECKYTPPPTPPGSPPPTPPHTPPPASQECKYTPPPTPPRTPPPATQECKYTPPPTPPGSPPPASQECKYHFHLKDSQHAFNFENGKLDAEPLPTLLLRKPVTFSNSSSNIVTLIFRQKEKNDAGPLSTSDDSTAQEKGTHCKMPVDKCSSNKGCECGYCICASKYGLYGC